MKANKGSRGIDGITVEQLPGHLKEHWPAIRDQLLRGMYKAHPVKRVEIAKPDGGMRQLGIPTVLDPSDQIWVAGDPGARPDGSAGGDAGSAAQMGRGVFRIAPRKRLLAAAVDRDATGLAIAQ